MTADLNASGELAAFLQRSVAPGWGSHQEAISFLKYPLGIIGIDVRVPDRNTALLATRNDLRHGLDDRSVIVLARKSEFLAQIAFSNQDQAYAGNIS